MSNDNPKTNYNIKLWIGKTDMSMHLNTVTIQVSKNHVFQKIFLNMGVNRTLYENNILPYKDRVKLDIICSKGSSSEDGTGDIDASFSYDLCIAEENGPTSLTSVTKDVPRSDSVTFTCVQRNQLKQLQEIVKDLSFTECTRKQILDKIMEKCPYVLQSKIECESDTIDQIFLQPCRRFQAIRDLNNRIRLFAPPPIYINYCIDGKVYMGSCIKNELEPIKIYIGSETNDLEDITTSASKENKNYDYSVIGSISQNINYDTTCISLGKNQKYCFFPMDSVFSKMEMNLNEYDDSYGLENTLGKDTKVSDHIKKTNYKETWVSKNGLPVIEGDSDKNKMFAQNHIFEEINQAVTLSMALNGIIKFQDFLMVGRRVKITAGKSAERYTGDYFLDSATISFQENGSYWSGGVHVVVKSSIKLGNC